MTLTHRPRFFTPLLVIGALTPLLVSCGQGADVKTPPPADDPIASTLEIAEAYVDGYYQDFTDQAYDSGYTDLDYSRLVDHSLDALATWQHRVDTWLAGLRAIDPAALDGSDAAIVYDYALDRIAAQAGLRACRIELWNVSPAWTGWQSALPSTFAQQPVGSDATVLSEAEANYEINRYLAVPGQALSYMTGNLEIQRLRRMAEERLGERFDVKAFHDRVIEDGTVTLGILQKKIERWVEENG